MGAFSLRQNWRRLAVPPPSSLRPLDGLRALSILWVVLFHSLWFLGLLIPPAAFRPLVADPALRLLWCGDLGVDIFFTLSGFLIADLLMEEHDRTRGLAVQRFYLRRAMRLLPAYAVVLSCYCRLRLPHCETAWANLLHVNNFIPQARQCMGWSWSLAIEEQFYLVFPLFLLALYSLPQRHRLRLLLCALAAASAVPVWLVATRGFTLPMPFFPTLQGPAFERLFDGLYDKPFARCGALLCGVLAAYLRRYTPFVRLLERHALLGAAGVGCALALLAAICLYPSRDPDLGGTSRLFAIAYLGGFRQLLSAAVAYLLLASLSTHRLGRALGRFLSLRCFYSIAQLSYSAYLVHPLCIIFVLSRLRPAGTPSHAALLGLALVELALSFSCATLVYLLVERPFMNLRGPRPGR